ncbi:hypothetical protein BDY19DRAFT_997371 [Irpex rosettiformis]|uniref:Uncharacterized protein n=1 Tax=Irpex rosettiformis TaxID=378272 RepID=A0ACB8TS25_9APHY|nr:hypothetical protein BDY19DRAFT_997371 [Irpex rosettiformis]
MGSPATLTYGPIFIGVVLNIMLYGIMVTQMFLYFTVYKRDKPWIKVFVCLLFLCDTLNTAFDIAFVYIPLVTKYGDVEALTYATWIFSTDPAMTSIIALMVQMFFAWRVKVLTRNWPLVSFIMLCSIVQWCGGLGTSIACGIIPEFIHFQRFKVIVIIWLAFSATADAIITAALVWHLRKHRTGFSKTDDVVNKIIRLTVQTGMITALCAVADLIAFLASPSGIHLVFNLPLAKLYTNSLMSSLNSRAGWKYGNSVGRALNHDEGQQSGSNDSNRGGRPIFGSQQRPIQQVFVDVESHEMKDRSEEHLAKTVRTVPSDMTVNDYSSEKRTILSKSLPSDASVA